MRGSAQAQRVMVRRQRIALLLGCLLLMLVFAAGRALYLGVVRGASLSRLARGEHEAVEVVPAQRGAIYAREGAALAVSEPAYEIVADPYLIKSPYSAAGKIAPLVGQSRQAVAGKLRERTGYLRLAEAVSSGPTQALLALGLPGIEAEPVMRRRYPRRTLAAQVIGLLGGAGEGLAGLEYSYNPLLSGRPGKRRVVRDGRGQVISVETVSHARAGESLTLTLDANIQHRVEAVLAADARVFHPKSETAIVLEPQTSAVLAMADWPAVNLESRGGVQASQLRNDAVALDYEPGSTFKIVAMGGALQQGLITPQSSFEVPEAIEMGGRLIHDAEIHPTETLTAAQILSRSSNVGEVKIAARLGAESFHRWTRDYGFGDSTGIELPGAESGAIPSPRSYSPSSMGNLPFGQGELVTPLQLADAYAAIANGGILRPPHIVAAVDGHRRPLPRGHRILSPATAATLRQMLRGPLGPEGTAAGVSVPGYQASGKTGTAETIDPATGEYSTTAFIASFIGFAPVQKPRLLALVIADEPQHGSIYGGQVAAPAWAQIMSFALPYLGVSPN
ncbi:MAG: peptidoglycan D,D-transpeptidase FtsI family protein [Solirubrobacteraceae bacterium]